LNGALGVLFQLDLSLGSITALERQVSAAVAEPVAQAHHFVQAQPVVNADETSCVFATRNPAIRYDN